MGKLRFLEVIIYDSWGILALAFLWAIDTASRNEIFHSEYILSFKILENFKYCLKRIGIDFNYIQKVIFSEYSIILILTVCVVFLSIGFYIIVPELLRASSYCAAVYFGSTLILDSKIDYKTQILLYTFLISTMCVNMLQATPLDHDHNSTMISKIFTRTTPAGFEFWLSLLDF